jgi:serine/threonine-protein kinase
LVYAISGRRGEAQTLLRQQQEESKHRYVSPHEIARIHAGLGDIEQALDWLEKACVERAGGIRNLKVDPAFDRLHPDPRFAYLLRRIGLGP